MRREENIFAWLQNVNNPKGLNTLKNIKRRIIRIFKCLCINLAIFSRKNTRCEVSYIHCLLLCFCFRFVLFFLLRIFFFVIKIFKTIFFCFHVLVEDVFELIYLDKNMKTKKTKDKMCSFLKILFQCTQKDAVCITCV